MSLQDSQQRCKPRLGVVSQIHESSDDSYKGQRVGVSFTNWDDRREYIVLTVARRSCYCAECQGAITRAAVLIREKLVHIYGPCWDLACDDGDIFYHEIERFDSNEVIVGKLGVWPAMPTKLS